MYYQAGYAYFLLVQGDAEKRRTNISGWLKFFHTFSACPGITVRQMLRIRRADVKLAELAYSGSRPRSHDTRARSNWGGLPCQLEWGIKKNIVILMCSTSGNTST